MIELFDDLEGLSRAAAELFAGVVRQSVNSRGRCSVLVSGGATPRRTYQLLAQEPHLSNLPWDSLQLFFGDERCVPSTDPASNALLLQSALVDRVPLAKRQVHPILCEGDPQAAAAAYEKLLEDYFKGGRPAFDLVLLGLGEDGHTASLFPGSPALEERKRWTAVAKKAGEDFMRVTLTPALLNQAGLVLFLVSGPGKARVLQELLEEPCDPDRLPARLIKPAQGELRWFLDRPAASLLGEATLAASR